MLSTMDMVVQQRDGPRWLCKHDDDEFKFWPPQLYQHLHPHSACHIGMFVNIGITGDCDTASVIQKCCYWYCRYFYNSGTSDTFSLLVHTANTFVPEESKQASTFSVKSKNVSIYVQ